MRNQRLRRLCVLFVMLSVPGLLPAKTPSVDGRWKLIIDNEGETRDYYMDLAVAGGKLSGTFISPRSGEYPIKEASLDGDKLKVVVDRDFDGNIITFVIEGKLLNSRKVSGNLNVNDGQFSARAEMTKIGNPLGKWEVTAKTPNGETRYVLELKRGKKGMQGTALRDEGKSTIKSVEWKDLEKLKVEYDLTLGDARIDLLLEVGFHDEDTLKGRWSAPGTDLAGEWSARRAGKKAFALAGRWKVTASTRDREHESVVTFSRSGDQYKGQYKGGLGEADYKSVHFAAGELKLELERELDGNPVPFAVTAKVTDDDTLEGRWFVKGNTDSGGKWLARRADGDSAPEPTEL